MSIRLHKFLGYGLADVKTKDQKIIDPRINKDAPIFDWDARTAEEYVAWLKNGDRTQSRSLQKNNDQFFFEDRPQAYRGLEDCMAWNPEYGLENVLVFQPLGRLDWVRQNDPIDYVTDSYLLPKDEAQRSYARVLEHGLHPWDSFWMDARDGRDVGNQAIRWKQMQNIFDSPEEELDEIAIAMGFENHAQAKELIVPIVPQEIRDLTKYLGVFATDDVWTQLRPMLYTYWS